MLEGIIVRTGLTYVVIIEVSPDNTNQKDGVIFGADMRTNNYNLPSRVLSVISGLNPEREHPTMKKIHTTELLMPAYARNLLVERWDDITPDYSDYLISVQGDALHKAYQKYLYSLGYSCEQRYEEEIDGVIITGTLDAFQPDLGILIDLKQTSIWSPSYKRDDYAKQTNCYAWFLRKHDYKVNKIVVDIWYRNWQLKQAGWSHDYPKIPYEQMEIPVWPIQKTENFIKDQIEYLTMCKDPCSREDRWQKYSVVKNKNKTPSKNCATELEAVKWIRNYRCDTTKKDRITANFTVVDSEPTNCISYCKARSVCPYAKSLRLPNFDPKGK